jgi:AcrR family transcriptional regulator
VRGRDTRSRILEAAVASLAAGGIEGLRIADVAERAGVSTALVHYHFETRETLLADALTRSFQVAGDSRASSKYGTGSAIERLRRKIDESLPYGGRREREWELWVELWLRAVREPELRRAAADVYARLRASLLELLDAGAAAGEFRLVDREATADRVLAAIDGFGLRALIGDPAMPVELAFDRVWAVLADDLLALDARGVVSAR